MHTKRKEFTHPKVFFRALRRMKAVGLLVGVKQRGAKYDELA